MFSKIILVFEDMIIYNQHLKNLVNYINNVIEKEMRKAKVPLVVGVI